MAIFRSGAKWAVGELTYDSRSSHEAQARENQLSSPKRRTFCFAPGTVTEVSESQGSRLGLMGKRRAFARWFNEFKRYSIGLVKADRGGSRLTPDLADFG